MKRCYLIRHGQTAWNGENRIQGHSDVPLSPLGEQQAQQLRTCFADRHLQGIVSSSLQRTRQTADAIMSGNGHAQPLIVEPRLREIHLGAWEGLTPKEVDARFQGAYQQWRLRPSHVVIPGAEPVETFRQRVRQAFEEIAAQFHDGEYAVVTHGGVIAALLADTLGADFDALLRRLRLDNAGITALELGGRVPHVLWINATDHLKSLLPPPLGVMWF